MWSLILENMVGFFESSNMDMIYFGNHIQNDLEIRMEEKWTFQKLVL